MLTWQHYGGHWMNYFTITEKKAMLSREQGCFLFAFLSHDCKSFRIRSKMVSDHKHSSDDFQDPHLVRYRIQQDLAFKESAF